MRRETQDGFRQRLRQEGRFKEFSALRKDLQAEGLSSSDSWNRAAAEFGFGEPRPVSQGVPMNGPQAGRVLKSATPAPAFNPPGPNHAPRRRVWGRVEMRGTR